jgi:hypothetical protein
VRSTQWTGPAEDQPVFLGGPVAHSGLGFHARPLKGLAHEQDAIEQVNALDTAATSAL